MVLGGGGMLGHKMFQTLREHFACTFCTVREDMQKPPFNRVELLQGDDVVPGVDVTDFAALDAMMSAFRPEYVVNCVGVIKQRSEAVAPIPSITINSLLPHKLARMAAQLGRHVSSISAPTAFSAASVESYLEGDLSDAEDLYGKTKFLGEVAVPNALTLRTSIIGRELSERRSLLEWFLAQNHKTIRGLPAGHLLGGDHQPSRRAGRLDHPGARWIEWAVSGGQRTDIQVRPPMSPPRGVPAGCRNRTGRSGGVGPEHESATSCARRSAYKCPPWPALVRASWRKTPHPTKSGWTTMNKILAGKRIVITGGTGSLGKILTRRILSGEVGRPAKVIIFVAR